MKRPIIVIASATLVAGAVAVVAFGGVAGSAAPANQTDRQTLARHILDPRLKAYMTPTTRAAFRRIATDGATSAPTTGSDLDLKATLGKGGAAPPAPSFANVRVNAPGTDSNRTDQTTQSETSIAVAGSNVVVGYNDSQHALFRASAGFDTIGVAYSTDGGAHFTDGDVIPNAPEFVNVADPWLASDRAGNVYFSLIMEDFLYGNDVIGVAKSTDGGKTFAPPVPTTRPTDFSYLSDKDAMAVGPDPVKARDNVYVAWDDFRLTTVDFTLGLALARSTDGGTTWDVTDVARNPLDPIGCSVTQYFGAQVGVEQSGTVYVAAEKVFRDNPDCTGGTLHLSEVIFRSVDGGKTFGPETKIADITQATPNRFLQLAPGKIMRTSEAPSLALDANNLYVAWNDGATGKSHIRLATSTDGGASWSVAGATQGMNDELQPAVSVNSKGVHLIYYRRNADNTLDVFLQNSRANGPGWDTLRVTSQSFPGAITVPNFDPWADTGYMGDFIANVSDGSRQYFAWGDNRDKVTNFLWPTGRNDPNVYFARQ